MRGWARAATRVPGQGQPCGARTHAHLRPLPVGLWQLEGSEVACQGLLEGGAGRRLLILQWEVLGEERLQAGRQAGRRAGM